MPRYGNRIEIAQMKFFEKNFKIHVSMHFIKNLADVSPEVG